MEHNQNRRNFLKHCATLAGGCCALLAWTRHLPGQESTAPQPGATPKPIDFSKLSYCGIPCAQVCELYQATVNNDPALKRKVYDREDWKKNFGLDFDPDKVFCHTCKPGDKPKKPGMAACVVRQCAQANGMESCVQCRDLNTCAQGFWKTWQDLYAFNKKNQARFLAQPGAVLIEPRSKG
jgi:hypothetical protein